MHSSTTLALSATAPGDSKASALTPPATVEKKQTQDLRSLQEQTAGVVLLEQNYDVQPLRNYFSSSSWAMMASLNHIGICRSEAKADTAFVFDMIGETTKEVNLSELKPYECFGLGVRDDDGALSSSLRFWQQTKLVQELEKNRDPKNTVSLDGTYFITVRGSIWWLQPCGSRCGPLKTPEKIQGLVPYHDGVMALDIKGQVYLINYVKDIGYQINRLCSAIGVRHVDKISRPFEKYFFTVDNSRRLTIWLYPKFGEAMPMLHFDNVLRSVKPVSTHNNKLFFVDCEKRLRVCNTVTWQIKTIQRFAREDLPYQLLLTRDQKKLIYINRKGINVLELGDVNLFAARQYLTREHLFPQPISNLICDYLTPEFFSPAEKEKNYFNPEKLSRNPVKALADCKFLADIPLPLRELTQNFLIDLLDAASNAEEASKKELHKHIDALLLLFFLYEQFPTRVLASNIQCVLTTFPNILTSETGKGLKNLLASYSIVESDMTTRLRYLGLFEVKLTPDQTEKKASTMGLQR